MHTIQFALRVAALRVAASLATEAPSKSALRPLPPSVLTATGRVRYFAFGSNLDAAKMASRGANGTAIAYESRWAATARDHRLAFNMRGFPPTEPAMAAIERAPGDSCPGCVYECDRDAYERLWLSEGGGMARPGYEEIVVRVADGDARHADALALAARPWAKLRRDVPPSARYLAIIETGARGLGLDAHADALAAMPRSDPSPPLKRVAAAHGVLAILAYRAGAASPLLRRLLAPQRALCFLFLYGGRSLPARAASEMATALVLAPTALLGASVQAARRLAGRPPITFGPPK